jgi:EmrB/QacA subfamily drug resistance transporter
MTAAQVPDTGQALSRRQILLIFSGLMLGMLLASLDQTIVATALPTIVGELKGLSHLSWVVTAYMLASTVTTPLYGKIGDIVGRKPVFQFAIVVFLIGSALSGVSQNMGQLIAFRAVQGLGAGGLMALAMAIIAEVVSPRERGRYQGYFGAVFALSSIIGPLLGGIFTDNLSWRWVFYINLPLGAAALIVTALTLRLPRHRIEHSIDWTGAALLVAGVTSLLLVTVWGGTVYAWNSPEVIGLSVAAVVILVAFALWERRTAEPILPPHLFRSRVFLVASALMAMVAIGMFGSIVYLPVFLQIVTGVSATNSGLLLTPLMLGFIVTSALVGRLVTATGRYKVFPIIGLAIGLVGFSLLSTIGVGTSRGTVSLYMVLLGVGIGASMPVMVLSVQNAADPRELGTATSAVSFFRSLGASLGVALFGAVMSSRLSAELTRLLPGGSLPPGVDATALQGSPQTLRLLPPEVVGRVVEAFANAIHVVFIAAVPVAALAFLLAWILPQLPLRSRPLGGVEAANEALGEAPKEDRAPTGVPARGAAR